MKKRFWGYFLSAFLISACIGCGAESTTSESAEAAVATAEEESTSKQAVEETTASGAKEEETTEETESQTPEAKESIKEVAPETETAEATPQPSTAPEPIEEPVAEPIPEPIPEPQVLYTYTDMTAIMYTTQTVNIRNLPNTDGEKIGSLSANQEVTVSGQCNETGWYMFDYNGAIAFVSNSYLSVEKAEVPQPAPETVQVSNVPNIANYPERTWIDMGEYFFYITPADEDGKFGVPYDYCDEINVILEERFPGNWTSSHGFYTTDNKLVSLGQKNMPNPACKAFVDANSR